MTTHDRHTLMRRLADSVDQLAYPYAHREVVEHTHNGHVRRYGHVTRHAPLVTQLSRSVEPSAGVCDGRRASYASAPSARLDAIDRYRVVAQGCARWLAAMEVSPRATLTQNVRALVGGAHMLDAEALADLVAEVRKWWVWTRVVTGWDTPAWTPHGPCPVCENLGGLRVRLAAAVATCVECGAAWDRDAIGSLAEYIHLWSTSRTTSSSFR
ncbi:MAG: hypothetical protein ACRDXX_08290 [Stackebrandtia sp.]